MGSKTKKLQDILNVGIGAVKTSQEVWDKLVTDLDSKKADLSQGFSKLKEEGESDYSDKALKIKVGAAWGIIKLDEIKDNIVKILNQQNQQEAESSNSEKSAEK